MAAHRRPLTALARRQGLSAADAEDAVQDALLKVARWPDLDPVRLLPALVTAVQRVAVDHLRAEQRRRRPLPAEPEALPSHESALCDEAEAAWLARHLPLLTPRERHVLELRVAGRSVRQIADALSVSPKTVETLLARARRRLGGVWRASLEDGALPAAPAQPMRSKTLKIGM